MKIKVLGSAAAEGWPALFCECEHCARARQNGGKDLRSRTSYLINGKLLVDMGPDIFLHDSRYGFFTRKLKAIVVTHTHEDHYCCDQFLNRCQYMSLISKRIVLAGSERIFSLFKERSGKTLEMAKLEKKLIEAGQTVELAGLKVTALRAEHQAQPGEICLNYVFQDNSGSVLIANDSGWWESGNWKMINDFKLNAAFIDSTCGLEYPKCRTGHMGAGTVVEFRDKLERQGCLKKDSQVFAIHFSHNGGSSHEELCRFFEPQSIEVAYDGMEVEF